MPEERTKMWRSAEEQEETVVAKIDGPVPSWTQGLYLRVGPGRFDFNDFTLNHWFDGYALLSRFEIEKGQIKFFTKFLESDAYKRACALNRPAVCEFGTKAHSGEPVKPLFCRLINSSLIPEFSDNTNIGFFKIGKDLFATGETCFFRSVCQDTLCSTEKHDTYKTVGLNVCSAHPLTDSDGTIYNLGTSVLTGLKYHFLRIPVHSNAKESLKKSKIIATIPSRWSTQFSYNHSFGMTENYFILIEQPFVLNGAKLLSFGLNRGQNQCFADFLEWKPELGNRFYIVEKSTGKVIKTEYVSQVPFFFLHYINCYEDDGHIVINVSIFDSPEIIMTQDLKRLRGKAPEDENKLAYGAKFVIPINVPRDVPENQELVKLNDTACSAVRKGKQIVCRVEIVSEKGLEFPAINQNFLRKKNQFYWATGLTTETTFANAICKVDILNKDVKIWSKDDHVFGEPVFIPRPGATEEDDGIIMVPMTDNRDEKPDCIFFFSASTMEEIGRAVFPVRIPPAIHGLFLQKSS